LGWAGNDTNIWTLTAIKRHCSDGCDRSLNMRLFAH
jgi:hypothetical protein